MLEAKGAFRISFSKERMTLLFIPKIVLETRLRYKGSGADRRVSQGFMLALSPSRRAISTMALDVSSIHCFTPHGIGSMRLSTPAATRKRRATSRLFRGPSKRGDTTRRSISLQRFAPPVAWEPKSIPNCTKMPSLLRCSE